MQWLLLAWSVGSSAQAQQLWCPGFVALQHRGLPGAGIEPVSPALAGGFLTTGPPEESGLGSFDMVV